jgi:hypothetical protein
MEATPDVLAQVPAGGGMNKPASGTYGEKTELAQLQAELPQAEPAVQPDVRPSPAAPMGGPPPSAPSGLPQGLMAPSQRPDVPVSTPLAGPAADPMAGAVDARQRRLRMLEILCYHPQASPELREFAENLKQKLMARG